MLGIARTAVAVTLAVFATAASAHEFKIKDLEFIHPWTREPAKGVKDVAVYMVLRNTGSVDDRIVGVSSSFATMGELRAGRAAGEGRVSAIEVPASATVELAVDVPHVLLLGLTEPLDGYQYFPLVLTFEKAGRIEIEVYVEEPN
jgi:periplasmic copper chaperone A